ncbi:MAG: GNAT family N-acetyltransferase, partial [Kibdelosporangium sp.]
MTRQHATHTDISEGWSLVDRLPARVASSCLYDSADWLRCWEDIGIEHRVRHGYVQADGPLGPAVLPLYALTSSPFWHGYLVQTRQTWLGSRHAFAGSTYSMYAKRGPFPEALARGAYATAMSWIEAGVADLLVAPNLTAEAVTTWEAAVGPATGQVLLDRTYSCELSGDFAEYLGRLPAKLGRDVQRRLRRGRERGLRVRMLEGPEAQALVPSALPLTIGTTDEHGWPPLYDEETLHCLLRVPGALLVAAQVNGQLVGVFFGFRHEAEVTFLCGGVDYSSLTEFSSYVALMYRCTEWACDNGFRRIEWGRDNYRFKERHGLTGTDLWALVYAPPDEEPGLRNAL